MRTLILSCNTGEGHNSCARAIKEIYDLHHADCDITDGLAFVSELASDFISWGHTFVYRKLPGLFRWGYSNVEKHPDTLSEDSRVYALFSKGVERLHGYICENRYDTVICVHVFPALMMTELKSEKAVQCNDQNCLCRNGLYLFPRCEGFSAGCVFYPRHGTYRRFPV